MVHITNTRLCDTDHTGRILQHCTISGTQAFTPLITGLLEAGTSETRPEIAKETHDRTGCGGEPTTEDPVVPESNSNEPGRTVMTDGGTEDIRDLAEVTYNDDDVRRYSADGVLYAYRDGDDHVIVSRGNVNRTWWTMRYPAERDAVITGERLWTIPENWNHRLKIKSDGERRYAIYHIPETGVDVLVTVPTETDLADARYGIERVGTLTVTYEGSVTWDELESTIEALRDKNQDTDEMVDALETLNGHRRSFEQEFAEAVDMYAENALLRRDHPVTIQQWTPDLWVEVFPVADIVQDFVELDDRAAEAAVYNLREADVLPYYPTVRVDVEEDEGLPDGYEVHALGETGASNAAILDYLATEYYDLMSWTAWAELRGKEVDPTITNVQSVETSISK
jgi:hypothetical protein